MCLDGVSGLEWMRLPAEHVKRRRLAQGRKSALVFICWALARVVERRRRERLRLAFEALKRVHAAFEAFMRFIWQRPLGKSA